jgi:hypothetical protein
MEQIHFGNSATRDDMNEIRTVITNFLGEKRTISEHVTNAKEYFAILAESEATMIEMSLDSNDNMYGWSLFVRLYFGLLWFTFLLGNRDHAKLTTTVEQRQLRQSKSFACLNDIFIPTSLLQVLKRETCPIYDGRLQITTYPYVRSGINISPIKQSLNGHPNVRYIRMTRYYSQIPAVRIMNNYLALFQRRKASLYTRENQTSLIIKFLFNGTFDGEEIIFVPTQTDQQVLNLVFSNPIFCETVHCSAKQLANSLDSINPGFFPAPIKLNENNVTSTNNDDSLWLEPMPAHVPYLTECFKAFSCQTSKIENTQISWNDLKSDPMNLEDINTMRKASIANLPLPRWTANPSLWLRTLLSSPENPHFKDECLIL